LEDDVDLVRDLLDKLVVDRNGRWIGRVDGVVLDREDNHAPRLAAILIGPTALAFRLHPVLGRWIARLERVCGLGEGRPVRIEAGDIRDVGRLIKTDVASSDTAALRVEQRCRVWLERIPGSQ
jgi:sporulation protein YlmC with PRC-barrel domain